MATQIVDGWALPSTGEHRIQCLELIDQVFTEYKSGYIELDMVLTILKRTCKDDEEFYRAIETNSLEYNQEEDALKPKETIEETQTRKDD